VFEEYYDVVIPSNCSYMIVKVWSCALLVNDVWCVSWHVMRVRWKVFTMFSQS